MLALAFRRHHAYVRHGVWLAASLKFLVPFALLVGAGSQGNSRPSRLTAATPIAQVVEVVGVPFAAPALSNGDVGVAGSAASENAIASRWYAVGPRRFLVVLLVWSAERQACGRAGHGGNRVVKPPGGGKPLGASESRMPGRGRCRWSFHLAVEPGAFGTL